MARTWLLVADSSRAKIYSVEGARGDLRELQSLEHPESRWPGRDLDTDRPGRSFDSAGEGRHAMEQEVGAKEQEAITFAQKLGERLESARTRQEYDKLMVVAAPAFLGLLRQKLSAETMKLVTLQLDKDLTRMEPGKLREHLPEVHG